MQYTQAQIDRANAVSLEDFLRTQGETLIKSGREYRWKEHDRIDNYLGKVTPREMVAIEKALSVSLAMEQLKKRSPKHKAKRAKE